MERRLRENGEATRNTVRSAERPSEHSERLERLVMRTRACLFFNVDSEVGNGGTTNTQATRLLSLKDRMQLIACIGMRREMVAQLTNSLVGKFCPDWFDFVFHLVFSLYATVNLYRRNRAGNDEAFWP